MPRPSLRSRSLRRIKTKLPGGASIIHYFRRRPSQALCAQCKRPLHGVTRARPAGIKRLTSRQRKPERPFGGNLCPNCTRERVKSRLR